VAEPKRCVVCGRSYVAGRRNVRRQKYCRARCARAAKRRSDRLYHQQADATAEGRLAKRVKGRQYRERVDWVRLLRYWRKAHPLATARTNRGAARRYYERHREQILNKRRRQRAMAKAVAGPRSQ
jgi:hypothetical protein